MSLEGGKILWGSAYLEEELPVRGKAYNVSIEMVLLCNEEKGRLWKESAACTLVGLDRKVRRERLRDALRLCIAGIRTYPELQGREETELDRGA